MPKEVIKKEVPITSNKSAEVIQAIHITTTAGDGSLEDPTRWIHEYWTLDGEFIGHREEMQVHGACAATSFQSYAGFA